MVEAPKAVPNGLRACSEMGRRRGVFDAIPARVVLYFLSWSGFLVSFVMRNDINIAIVEMVAPAGEPAAPDQFDWSFRVRASILGTFYWWYVVAQVAGGVATQHFGTKAVFGWSQLATAICSLLVPTAARTHYGWLVGLRSVQGFASGLTWPAMYAIVGYWIPPSERSRFMSSFQGFSIGIGLTYPLCGWIIAHWGWPPVFYTTGSIGAAWCVVWWLLAFNRPSEHPRITDAERRMIEAAVAEDIRGGYGMAPRWGAIFRSAPAWAIAVTTFGRIWLHYMFIMFGPVYMNDVLGFDIETNGVLSGAPFLCSYLSALAFCAAADWMVARGVRLLFVRKIFTAVSQVVPGVLIFCIAWSQHQVAVLVMWFVAVSCITAGYAGAMANIIDIAPNLAGPVLAFAQTIHMSASFIAPIAASAIVKDTKSTEQWMTAFGLATAVAVATYLPYLAWAQARPQPWNYPKESQDDGAEEPLQTQRV
ncbi:vesicular glutamate transporter 2 [Phlebotomus argentipes]|uniref:vesicular glutamate transporter 2 n=1 Tax=Phlebotomus argentipes TaxID=94469 RepID=UPI00289331FC|nr:vesicular glutamate transporter 2 [Phlebotomus argentipes]